MVREINLDALDSNLYSLLYGMLYSHRGTMIPHRPGYIGIR